MIFTLIRFAGFYTISKVMYYIGYGVNTKQYWIILVTTFIMCIACGIEGWT